MTQKVIVFVHMSVRFYFSLHSFLGYILIVTVDELKLSFFELIIYNIISPCDIIPTYRHTYIRSLCTIFVQLTLVYVNIYTYMYSYVCMDAT